MYRYSNFKLPLEEELMRGLATIAVYFSTTHGIPLEIFNQLLENNFRNKAEQLRFYMHFRNNNEALFT